MINALISGIIDLFFQIITIIATIIFLPIEVAIKFLMPDINTYLTDALEWLSNNLINGIAFVREVFLNLTGIPRPLYTTLVGIIIARITFHYSIIGIKFVANMYRLYKNGDAGGKMVE